MTRRRLSPFAKFKKWFGYTENTVLALLAFKFPENSFVILCVKIGSSYVMNSLELFFN